MGHMDTEHTSRTGSDWSPNTNAPDSGEEDLHRHPESDKRRPTILPLAHSDHRKLFGLVTQQRSIPAIT